MSAKFRASVLVLHQGKDLSFWDLDEFLRTDLIRTESGPRGSVSYFNTLPTLEILTFNCKSFELNWTAVKQVVAYPDREIDELRLRSGGRCYVERGDPGIVGVERSSLRLSTSGATDTLFLPRVDRLTSDCFPILERVMPVASPYDKDDSWLPLNERLGYVIGAMVGAGVAKRNKIQLSCESIDVRRHFYDCLLWQFGGGTVTRDCLINEDPFVCQGVIGQSLESWTGDKCFPNFFLLSPASFRNAVFAGLMDTAGMIFISGAKATAQLFCNFSSLNLLLVQQVKWLAASLGIKGKIVNRQGALWHLDFDSSDMCRWDRAGLADMKKAAKLWDLRDHNPSRNDRVPISSELAKHIYKLANRKDAAENSIRVTFLKAKDSGEVSRSSARRAVSLFGDRILAHHEGELWSRLVSNNEIGWDQVQAIHPIGTLETGHDLILADPDCRPVAVDGLIV